MLTADSTGAKDSTIRGNAGIKAMIRPDAPGWNMVVGKHIPLPPQSTTPAASNSSPARPSGKPRSPTSTFDDKDRGRRRPGGRWARELAVSGTVAKIPIGGGTASRRN